MPSTTPSTKAAKAKSGAEQRQKQLQRTAALLKHASDPTRLRVLIMLSENELHVGAICEELEMGQPAVSHHLTLLRHGGIIFPRRQGKNTFYALTETGETLAEAARAVMA